MAGQAAGVDIDSDGGNSGGQSMNHRLPLPALLILASMGATLAQQVDFKEEVKPILETACLSCHGRDKPKGGLSIHTREATLAGGDSGASVIPGKPEDSLLYTLTILPPDDIDIMPPKGDPLAFEETETLRRWIEQGALWPGGVELEAVQKVDFVRDIQPLLETHCVACHREGHDDGGLRLDHQPGAMAGGESGRGIVPGKSSASMIYTATILPEDHDDLMPPVRDGGPLDRRLTRLLRQWIDQGALWPEGLILTPRAKDAIAASVDMDLVRQIHQSIVAGSTVSEESEMRPYTEKIPGTRVEFDMVPIPSGSFLMGSPPGEAGRAEDEGPQARVAIAPFWMGRCEVTWNEYELFMYPEEMKRMQLLAGAQVDNPVADAVTKPSKPYVEMSFGMGKDGYPAISMTQHAANKYCEWLSAATGHYYRLPTEAEWEYACRAGTATAWSFGDSADQLGQYAWYQDTSDFKYQKVGRKKPNPWGLHDMHGNVSEWTLDQYDPGTYSVHSQSGELSNPWIPSSAPYPHSVRGGSWMDAPELLRSAVRFQSHPDWKMQDPQLPKSVWYHTDAQFLGFRVVRPLAIDPPETLARYWTNGVELD